MTEGNPMSDIPADYAERLNLSDVIARIERQREEAQKLNAERNKLAAEQNKLVAETLKLAAEEAKLRRERSLAPFLAAAALGGLLTAVGGFLWGLMPAVLRSLNVH